MDTVCIYSIHQELIIRILDTPRLHRQRKGRRKTVRVMDQEELAVHFGVAADAPDDLQMALEQAGWPYHEDATGRLWSVSQENVQ